jgi:hypothetical protein
MSNHEIQSQGNGHPVEDLKVQDGKVTNFAYIFPQVALRNTRG